MTLKYTRWIYLIPVALLLAWIATYVVRINSFTLLDLLEIPRQFPSVNPGIAGKYILSKDSASRSVQSVLHAKEIKVMCTDNLIVFVYREEVGESYWIFRCGRNAWVVEPGVIKYRLDRSGAGPRILPGYGREMEEGTISLDSQGRLEIRSSFWQYALICYLIPLYEQVDHFEVFQKTRNDERGAIVP